MKELTVKDLYAMCFDRIKAGDGDKKVFVSSDDECNDYHQIWFGFEHYTDEIIHLR